MPLEVQGLVAGYGRLTVLRGVDLALAPGEVAVALGANGAGKTTLCRTLAGVVAPSGGRIVMDGRDLTRAPASERVRAGLVLVPEGRQVFPRMTVRENLRLGAFPHGEPRPADYERVEAMFPALRERRGQMAGLMSGGEQQMLAIARGLMARPRCLMLDEPSQGLAPRVVEQIGDAIRAVAEEGMAVLLVEQNLGLAARAGGVAHVLEAGRIQRSGPTAEMIARGAVEDSYLGRG